MLTNLLFVVLAIWPVRFPPPSWSVGQWDCRDPRKVCASGATALGGGKSRRHYLAGDFAKGLLPVLLARLAGVEDTVWPLTALAAFLGHLSGVLRLRGRQGCGDRSGRYRPLVSGGAGGIRHLAIHGLRGPHFFAARPPAALTPLFAWGLGCPVFLLAVLLVGGAAGLAATVPTFATRWPAPRTRSAPTGRNPTGRWQPVRRRRDDNSFFHRR